MTERVRRDQPLNSLQGDDARYRWMTRVFMDAADPILIEDLDGYVIDMNHEAQRAYGWTREELLGKHICTIVPEDRHDQALQLLEQCKAGKDVRNIEGLRQDKSGRIAPVLITLSLLQGENGEPVGIASIAKNMSRQKAVEESLRTDEIGMDAGSLLVMHEVRDFMFERVYLRPDMEPQRRRAQQIIRELVEYFLNHPDKIPATYLHEDADTLTQVIDYVAGMTDRFAMRMHDGIFRPRLFD